MLASGRYLFNASEKTLHTGFDQLLDCPSFLQRSFLIRYKVAIFNLAHFPFASLCAHLFYGSLSPPGENEISCCCLYAGDNCYGLARRSAIPPNQRNEAASGFYRSHFIRHLRFFTRRQPICPKAPIRAGADSKHILRCPVARRLLSLSSFSQKKFQTKKFFFSRTQVFISFLITKL